MNRLLRLSPALLLLTTACACDNPAPTDGGGTTEEAAPVVYHLPDGRQFDEGQVEAFAAARKEGSKAYDDKDYAACIAGYQKALDIYDRSEIWTYNLACCQALAGQTDAAIANLQKAVDLGYAYADRIREDEDLASLVDTEAFDAVLAQAEEVTAAKEAESHDPAEGATNEVQAFESTEALESYFDKRQTEELRPLLRMLGGKDRRALMDQDRRTKIAAYAQWLDAHPDDLESRLRMLEILGKFRPASPQYEAGLKAFAAEHPDTVWAAAAAYKLDYEAKEDVLFDDEHEDHETALAALRSSAREIVEAYPDDIASKDAYYQLLREARDKDDLDQMRMAFDWLEARRDRIEPFWSERAYTMTNSKIRVRGLPEFSTADLDGKTWTPESMKGQVVLVDFWATWCGPCIAEMPNLKEIYAAHRDKGFEILGVSADELEEAEFKEWLVKEEVPWPQSFTGEGWKSEMLELFEIKGIPTAILVDKNGEIVGVDLRGEELKAKVESLVG